MKEILEFVNISAVLALHRSKAIMLIPCISLRNCTEILIPAPPSFWISLQNLADGCGIQSIPLKYFTGILVVVSSDILTGKILSVALWGADRRKVEAVRTARIPTNRSIVGPHVCPSSIYISLSGLAYSRNGYSHFAINEPRG